MIILAISLVIWTFLFLFKKELTVWLTPKSPAPKDEWGKREFLRTIPLHYREKDSDWRSVTGALYKQTKTLSGERRYFSIYNGLSLEYDPNAFEKEEKLVTIKPNE